MVFKSTIESVLSDISSKIGKLRDLAEKHSANVGVHLEQASRHSVLAGIEAGARDRATRIAEKFEDLLK